MNSPRVRCGSYLKRDGIYAILDAGILPEKGLPAAAGRLARKGVRVFQLRAKGLPDRHFLDLALRLRGSLRGRILLINDRVDIALLANADGVHLGQEDVGAAFARRLLGPRKTVGISAGTPHEIGRALKARPDYISLGPAFCTRTKRDAGIGLGPGGIRRLARKIPRGMIRVAVGGITADNVGIILRCGIEAVAAASGLLLGAGKGREADGLLQAVGAAKAAGRGQCGEFGTAGGCGGRIA